MTSNRPASLVILAYALLGFAIGAGLKTVEGSDTTSAPASQPASQPAGPLIVEGQVVDHVGAGVKDVEVRVFLVADGRREELGAATTDNMGDFKLHGPKTVHGQLIVAFRKAGFKPHEVEVESVPDELPPFVDYRLGGALTLTGTVHDALKDSAVEGAKVAVRSFADEKTALSDASGRFEIAEMLPGKTKVVIEAEGYARWQETVDMSERAEPLTVRLEPERIVHLQITDDDKQPIAAAVVEMLVADVGDYRTLPSDAEGKVTVRGLGLKAERIEVRLSHPEFVSAQSFDRAVELPADQAESSHTLIMTPAATIVGKVVSAADNRPLGGARLTVGERLDEAASTAYSDFDGTFVLGGVPPGEAVVTVHLTESAPRLFAVNVAAKGRTLLEVSLSPAAQVRGRVLDPDGKPVAGAHVVAVKWKDYQTLGLQAMTDAEGRFVITDAPSDSFSVDVYAVGFRPLRGQDVEPGAEERVLKFTEVRAAAASPMAAGPKEGEVAPDFELVTLDGRKIKREDLKGKWALLDFWATWCGPCVQEVPTLLAVHKEFAGRKDLEIIGVSLDMDEKALRKFVGDRKIAWPQVYGDDGGATRTAEQFGVIGIPMTYLIGPDGRIAASGLRGESVAVELRKRLGTSRP